MSFSPKKNPRFRAGKKKRSNGKRISKTTTVMPQSPQSIVRRKTLLKRQDRGDVVGVAKSNKGKPAKNKRPKSGRSSKFSLLPLSIDVLEKNCFRDDQMPEGYKFVQKGDVYITRHCRIDTKKSGRIVYAVYDKRGKTILGLRVPAEIHKAVLDSAAESAESRANAVKLRDEKYMAQARRDLCKEYPQMPVKSLESILQHAYVKGTGRVGRAQQKSSTLRTDLAVEAHIRHTHTPYEALLTSGMERGKARKQTRPMVLELMATWAKDGDQPTGLPSCPSSYSTTSVSPASPASPAPSVYSIPSVSPVSPVSPLPSVYSIHSVSPVPSVGSISLPMRSRGG
ncbi:hypothetical protein BO71DRAFT_219345 [Aspergillus ellipticus CBS 707.79]|uniref:DUF2293 domain-containing protein n=1 Tax=Aspergillus ellipticus CBS 707.79 TaxID=1448320 RepID=A0A319DC74_9EURO|nr:hypothetical protein BO71DRAFT_219345 [Aspergillus ellipticus CBS 707.79]